MTKQLKNLDFNDSDSDYIIFIKSGDLIAKPAIARLTQTIGSNHPDIIYTDETIKSTSNKIRPLDFHKPDFSLDMQLSMHYFGNLLCVKTTLLKKIALPQQVNNLNFLYVLSLKLISKTNSIIHIAEALYINKAHKVKIKHLKQHSNQHYLHSYLCQHFDQEDGRRALSEYCQENNLKAEVLDGKYHGTYRLKRELDGKPLVSIIIPTRDKADLLRNCIHSILEKSTYDNFEIIGIDNGSIEPETLNLIREFEQQDQRIKFYRHDIAYNYSKLMNFAMSKAQGEHYLLLNNDTKVITPGWIEAMLEQSQRKEIGIVGAKLLYQDNTIQHAGFITTSLTHTFRGEPNDSPGYFYFPHIIRNYNAVTFACIMISRDVADKLGKLDESLAISCNDIEYCIRARNMGYLNIYTPYACLYHLECQTRGAPDTTAKLAAEQQERDYMISLNPKFYQYDEYHNINLDNMHKPKTQLHPRKNVMAFLRKKFPRVFTLLKKVKTFIKLKITAKL